jgi:hypothetical protein
MAKRWLATAVLLAGLGWAAPASYVFLLDASQSMIGREDSRVLVWPFVQRQLLRFGDAFPRGQVRVIPFGSAPLASSSFIFPRDRAAFRRYVRGLPMGQPHSAIYSSVAQIYARECRTGARLYLFTDGLDNRSERAALPQGGACSFSLVTAGRSVPAAFSQRLQAATVGALAQLPTEFPRVAEVQPKPVQPPKPAPAAKAEINQTKPVRAAPQPVSKPLPQASRPNPLGVPSLPRMQPNRLTSLPPPAAHPRPPRVQETTAASGPQPDPEVLLGTTTPDTWVIPVTAAQEVRTAAEPQGPPFPLWPWLLLAVALFIALLARKPRPAPAPKQPPLALPTRFAPTLALGPGARSHSRIELLLPQEAPMLVYPSATEPINLGQHLRLPGLTGLSVRLTPEGMVLCALPEQATARVRSRHVRAGDLIGYGEILALETAQGQSLGWIRPANRRLSLREP